MNSAYDEGFEARLAGRPETDNPYDDDTEVSLSWNDGWQDGGRPRRRPVHYGYVCVASDGLAVGGGPIERLTHDFVQVALSEGYSIHPCGTSSGASEHVGQRFVAVDRIRDLEAEIDRLKAVTKTIAALKSDFIGVTDNPDDASRCHTWDWLEDNGWQLSVPDEPPEPPGFERRHQEKDATIAQLEDALRHERRLSRRGIGQ